MKWFSQICTILFLSALAAGPPILYGYASLSRAQSTPVDGEASIYYETAARMLFWRSDLYEEAGMRAADDPQRAIRLLLVTQQQGGLGSLGRLALGDAFLSNNETSRAMREWEMLLAEHMEIASVSQRLAKQYHIRKDYDNEMRVLKAWLETDGTNPEASEQMGLLLAASAAPEALPLLRSAAEQSQQAANRLNGLITALDRQEKDRAYLLALSGQALALMNEWALAEQAFELSVAANSNYANAWAWLGTARQHNNSSGALNAIEEAIHLEPNSAAIHTMLGNYWQNAGQPVNAISEFQAATRIEPGNPAWWQALAGAQAQNDLSAALDAYIKSVNIAPQEAIYWFSLAAFCVEKNAYLEDYGLNAALRAFALEPKNPEYIDMLGRAQMAVGQLDAAEVSFNKAIKLGSSASIPGTHLHMGLLYLQTDRQANAKLEFEETLRLDPNGSYGSQAKKIIERYFTQK
jgi:tetratricopeptide (TPR) repeat protein